MSDKIKLGGNTVLTDRTVLESGEQVSISRSVAGDARAPLAMAVTSDTGSPAYDPAWLQDDNGIVNVAMVKKLIELLAGGLTEEQIDAIVDLHNSSGDAHSSLFAGKLDNPSGGMVGQVLTRTASGTEWAAVSSSWDGGAVNGDSQFLGNLYADHVLDGTVESNAETFRLRVDGSKAGIYLQPSNGTDVVNAGVIISADTDSGVYRTAIVGGEIKLAGMGFDDGTCEEMRPMLTITSEIIEMSNYENGVRTALMSGAADNDYHLLNVGTAKSLFAGPISGYRTYHNYASPFIMATQLRTPKGDYRVTLTLCSTDSSRPPDEWMISKDGTSWIWATIVTERNATLHSLDGVNWFKYTGDNLISATDETYCRIIHVEFYWHNESDSVGFNFMNPHSAFTAGTVVLEELPGPVDTLPDHVLPGM